MRHDVTAARDMRAMLGEIVAYIADPRYLYRGRPPGNFDLLPREALVNWLTCAVLNHQAGSEDRWTFSTDPMGGDGILIDRVHAVGWPTEHVFIAGQVLEGDLSLPDLIENAVTKKREKGKPYATGKHLFVFSDVARSAWKPNEVGRILAGKHDFEAVWAVGLQEAQDQFLYTYWVTQFGDRISSVYLITIDIGALKWEVHQVQ